MSGADATMGPAHVMETDLDEHTRNIASLLASLFTGWAMLVLGPLALFTIWRWTQGDGSGLAAVWFGGCTLAFCATGLIRRLNRRDNAALGRSKASGDRETTAW